MLKLLTGRTHHSLPLPSMVAASRNAVSVPSADERRCLSCGVQLESREEQVAHYKLDWHKYNVKRKLAGLPCVEEDAFEAMSGVSHKLTHAYGGVSVPRTLPSLIWGCKCSSHPPQPHMGV